MSLNETTDYQGINIPFPAKDIYFRWTDVSQFLSLVCALLFFLRRRSFQPTHKRLTETKTRQHSFNPKEIRNRPITHDRHVQSSNGTEDIYILNAFHRHARTSATAKKSTLPHSFAPVTGLTPLSILDTHRCGARCAGRRNDRSALRHLGSVPGAGTPLLFSRCVGPG